MCEFYISLLNKKIILIYKDQSNASEQTEIFGRIWTYLAKRKKKKKYTGIFEEFSYVQIK